MKIEVEKDGAKETLEADYVLVSVGRKPSLTGIDAAALGLGLGKRGEITVDAEMRTNLPNVFAIGDAVGGVDALAPDRDDDIAVLQAQLLDHRIVLGNSQPVTLIDRFGLCIFGKRCRIADEFAS